MTAYPNLRPGTAKNLDTLLITARFENSSVRGMAV